MHLRRNCQSVHIQYSMDFVKDVINSHMTLGDDHLIFWGGPGGFVFDRLFIFVNWEDRLFIFCTIEARFFIFIKARDWLFIFTTVFMIFEKHTIFKWFVYYKQHVCVSFKFLFWHYFFLRTECYKFLFWYFFCMLNWYARSCVLAYRELCAWIQFN